MTARRVIAAPSQDGADRTDGERARSGDHLLVEPGMDRRPDGVAILGEARGELRDLRIELGGFVSGRYAGLDLFAGFGSVSGARIEPGPGAALGGLHNGIVLRGGSGNTIRIEEAFVSSAGTAIRAGGRDTPIENRGGFVHICGTPPTCPRRPARSSSRRATRRS